MLLLQEAWTCDASFLPGMQIKSERTGGCKFIWIMTHARAHTGVHEPPVRPPLWLSLTSSPTRSTALHASPASKPLPVHTCFKSPAGGTLLPHWTSSGPQVLLMKGPSSSAGPGSSSCAAAAVLTASIVQTPAVNESWWAFSIQHTCKN